MLEDASLSAVSLKIFLDVDPCDSSKKSSELGQACLMGSGGSIGRLVIAARCSHIHCGAAGDPCRGAASKHSILGPLDRHVKARGLR